MRSERRRPLSRHYSPSWYRSHSNYRINWELCSYQQLRGVIISSPWEISLIYSGKIYFISCRMRRRWKNESICNLSKIISAFSCFTLKCFHKTAQMLIIIYNLTNNFCYICTGTSVYLWSLAVVRTHCCYYGNMSVIGSTDIVWLMKWIMIDLDRHSYVPYAKTFPLRNM
jgi:hypothetical protein